MSSRRSRERAQRIMTIITLIVLLTMILGTGALVFSNTLSPSPSPNTTEQSL
jgi:hypothetical protein